MSVELAQPPIGVPPLTRGWRMRMAMEWGGRSREYMAAVLGVSLSTVSRWLHDEGVRQPRRPDMETWARECGVPLAWLAPGPDDEPIQTSTVAKVALQLAASNPKPNRTPRQSPVMGLVPPVHN